MSFSEKEVDFRELSSQLVGRLIGASKQRKGTKHYLESVRKWRRGPYVWPGKGCLESEEFVEEDYTGRQVWKVALLSDPKKVVVGALSVEVLLVAVRLAEIMQRYVGHMRVVTSVPMSRDDQ